MRKRFVEDKERRKDQVSKEWYKMEGMSSLQQETVRNDSLDIEIEQRSP